MPWRTSEKRCQTLFGGFGSKVPITSARFDRTVRFSASNLDIMQTVPTIMRLRIVLILLGVGTMAPAAAFAQAAAGPFEIGGQVAAAALRQFGGSDVGVGARVGWRPSEMLRVEAEVNVYPSDFPDRFPFTRGRTEALFGTTMGWRFGRIGAFGRVRPGFVTFGEAPAPIACIAIFPPPLSCRLAAGATLFALDFGGGVEVAATETTFFRVDAGDRAIRYPGPTLDANRRVRSDAFFS